MKGYLINLKSRPDRLERFNNQVRTYLPDIDIELVEAIDGSKLDISNEELRKNVNPWNFKHLKEKTLRGVIGCCLSHLECYKKISQNDNPHAIVFEDDCVFIKGQELGSNDLIKNIKLPEKFGVIWLGKWDRGIKLGTKNTDNLVKIIKGYKTGEAYIISKDFASILYEENICNIGAIDAHIGLTMGKYPDYPCYTYSHDIFTQYDRTDSNIR
jgi:GR25 family glycosyltransferase involved in LPS biosynthesis